MLVTVGIVALISTIGFTSFDVARRKGRDAKRVSDATQIRLATELYFEYFGKYPRDGVRGPGGIVIGSERARVLTVNGFEGAPTAQLFLLAPENPGPGGAPYLYRSLNLDGTDCDADPCFSYAMSFTLEAGAGVLVAGAHALTPQGIVGASGGTGSAGALQDGRVIGQPDSVGEFAAAALEGVTSFISDPTVQATAEGAVAPAATVAVVATAATAQPSLALYLLLFFTEPVLIFGRRHRNKAWGTVFNSVSRLGEDLVIVRLLDARTRKLVKSTVTDRDGRYSFLVDHGEYVIQVVKRGVSFPSVYTAGMKNDGPYPDLYHGERISVGRDGAVLTPNIPVDPAQSQVTDRMVARRDHGATARRYIAALGPSLGGLAFAVTPNGFTALLFVAQVVTYALFRKLAVTPPPQRWGIVYEAETGHPVHGAVVRVFESRFNRLLEAQISDSRGRYSFRVGGNAYYITLSKDGYKKTITDPFDLSSRAEPSVIAAKLPMQKVLPAHAAAAPHEERVRHVPEPAPALQPEPAAEQVVELAVEAVPVRSVTAAAATKPAAGQQEPPVLHVAVEVEEPKRTQYIEPV